MLTRGRGGARLAHAPARPPGTHVDHQREGLPGVVFDPLLPLGRGELRVGEVVQAELAAPLGLLGLRQLLGRCCLVCVDPAVEEEVHGGRGVAQSPG